MELNSTGNLKSPSLSWDPSYLPYVWAKYQKLCVDAPLALFGLIGCVLSALILKRAGLQKPSNCLLLGLALSDGCHLASRINIPELISYYYRRKLPKTGTYWEFSYTTSFALFVLYQLLYCVRNFATRMTSAMTVYISAERLIALFLPLHFRKIVTPKRVWILMMAALLFWSPILLYIRQMSEFRYIYNKEYDAFYGKSKLSKDSFVSFLRGQVMSYIHHVFPTAFVSVASVCIGVGIALKNKARSELTNNKTGNRKSLGNTTRTLLAVCVVFCVYKIMLQIHLQLKLIEEPLVTHVVRGLSEFMSVINSSVNFIIYIVLNKNFRDIFKTLFTGKRIE